MTPGRRILALAGTALAAGLGAFGAWAQGLPRKRVRFIAPRARMQSRHLTARGAQPVIDASNTSVG